MKYTKFSFCLVILLLSTILNYYTHFGFLLDLGVLLAFWLLIYCIIMPISLMACIFNEYKWHNKLKWCGFIAYLLSVFISSGIDSFDFYNFEIQGDGATKYAIRVILFTCITSLLISFLFFQIKSKRK